MEDDLKIIYSGSNYSGMLFQTFIETSTAWKTSVFRIFLVRIFPHSAWIRENTHQENLEYGHFSQSEVQATLSVYPITFEWYQL